MNFLNALEKVPGIVWELRETTPTQEKLVYQSSDLKFPAFKGTSFLNQHKVYRQMHVKLADREWHILLHVSHKQLAIQGSNAPLLVLVLALPVIVVLRRSSAFRSATSGWEPVR